MGRGGATLPQESLADSDCIIIMGSNMAENHPVGFRFVMKAKERGATVIHIDPRFSRTSAMADLHVPIRPGTDLAFLGGLINHALTSERWNSDPFFKTYVSCYTNGPVLINEDFRGPEELGGLFSGYDPETRKYDYDTWQYMGAESDSVEADEREAEQAAGQVAEAEVDLTEEMSHELSTDPSMQDPRCAFQIVKRTYSRYTPEMIEQICGVPRDLFLKVADALLESSGAERTAAFCYAVAWTQHTNGSQTISACALLQLLLGNIGRPGGGILALRGHATIQGSTDIPTLYDLLPGYMPMPTEAAVDDTFSHYIETHRHQTGYWYKFPNYLVSLLQAWYGEHATPENGFAFDLVPKISGDYSFEAMMPMMKDGIIKGLFCMGMNPAVGGQNSTLIREGLANLDWMVVRDPYEIETAAFWYDAPEVRDGRVRREQIKTEIFFLPPAVTPEKDGSYTNTQRLVQWHDKAVEPPGDCRSEPWFLYHLGRRLKAMYADDDSVRGEQIRSITWDYPTDGPTEDVVLESVLGEINGYTVADRKPVSGDEDLKDDGSTACGCWIYSGVMPEEGVNRARSREGDDRASLGWGYAWPGNRRILYNRASADPEGRPWSERKKWVWWDAEAGEWTGYDVPDFPVDKPPDFEPEPDAVDTDAHPGTAPFTMMTDGRALLFAATGMEDGPLPVHYEPWESPVTNLLYPEQTRSPVATIFDRPDNPYHEIGDPRFPYVMTTYRLTEHHTAGGMSRFLGWLSELQPEGFCEISPELAAQHGVDNGDWVTISTLRGEIEVRALVTDRVQPLRVHGREMHQVGMPWHFGWSGMAKGDIANELTPLIEDPNALIHEGKAFTCNLRKGRKPVKLDGGRP
jgi:formate dehydrogenase major subunit